MTHPADSGFAWPPSADDLDVLEMVEVPEGSRSAGPMSHPPGRHTGNVRRTRSPDSHRATHLRFSICVFSAGVLLGAAIPGTRDGRAPVLGGLSRFGVGASYGQAADAPGPHTGRDDVQAADGGNGTSTALAPDSGHAQRDEAPPVEVSPVGDRSAPPSSAGPASTARTGAGRRRTAPRRSPDERQVLDVMHQYQSAYSRMDVARLQALWPAGDRDALARTFGATSEHRLTLDRCVVEVSDADASTRCLGVLRFRPRRSDARTGVQRQEWTFQLQRGAGHWAIASVASRPLS